MNTKVASANRETEKNHVLFNVILVIVTATLTGIAQYLVTQQQLSVQQRFWVQQQRLLGEEKRHVEQLEYLERAERELAEYPRTSYIWFFAYLAVARGENPGAYDEKHAAFHHAEAGIEGLLSVVPFFFGKPVQQAADDLSTYLGESQWEGIVQAPSFVDRDKTLNKEHSAETNETDLISTTIHIDEYDRLVHRLTGAMAQEISQDESVPKQ